MTAARFVACLLALIWLPLTAAPAAPSWAQTVVATPDGGFRMGNPKARVRLIEYGSLTCPHCAHFDRTGMTGLLAYVRKGTVSYEYRNYILNGIDVAASLAARCGGPSRFFPMARTLYATQTQWVGRIVNLPQAEKDKLKSLPESQRLTRIAQLAGIATIAKQRGIPAAQLSRCLGNTTARDRLGKMHEAAQALGVSGTPTFFMNGRLLDVNEWPGIEAEIRQAGG